jgi:tripartite-type tricarboxylate transporter receptor subunit TctC
LRSPDILVVACCLAALVSGQAAAQSWPQKPVHFIATSPPGGAVDISARLLGEPLAKIWGQPVVVENRGGAGGNIGAAEAARAAPDGYTLLFAAGTAITANPYIYEKLGYQPGDLVPVTNVAQGAMALVVPSASQFNSVAELIQAAKANPGKLTFGHGGSGSQPHLAAENFIWYAKIDVLGVPYKGAGAGVAGLVAGETDFFVATFPSAVSYIRAGRLRALGVTSRTPAPQLPGVPPIAETIPRFENFAWYGLLAPKATAGPLVQKIYQDAKKALQSPELVEKYFAQGLVPVANTPDEFSRAIKAEAALWASLVKERQLQPR